MQRKRYRNVLLASLLTLTVSGIAQALPVWTVENSEIMKDGELFRIKGGSWFGLEGRHEAPNDADNPNGAPMELYMGNVWWSPSKRTYASTAKDIADIGFNCIRMPVAPQTFDDSDPQGTDYLKNDTSVRIKGAFSALKAVLKAIDDAGMYTMLDIHSCSNYVGWRAGRLDSRPPFTDANRGGGYAYTREDCSCAAEGNPSTVKKERTFPYDKQKWLENLKTLAGLDKELGLKNGTIGIDIFNEPWDYSWEEWKTMIEEAYQAIHSVNPNILVFAQGIGGKNGVTDGNADDAEDTPYGDVNVNWGENLYEAGDNPPDVPVSKLVYSPHCYGPSVCTQDFFADWEKQPECKGLVEDAFGDAKCQIVFDDAKKEFMYAAWDEHFGYLRGMGYALAPGEYGGNMDWPAKAEKRHQDRYSYLTNKKSDEEWQNIFVDYMIDRGIVNSFYWSINPESADTYGVFATPYDPINNTGGWGTWNGTDKRKVDLLKRLWAAPVKTVGVTVPYKTVSNSKNAFNCRVTSNGLVSYTLPTTGNVTAKLYNIDGRLHGEIMNKNQNAGSHSFNFTAPSGSYVLVLKAGNYSSKQVVSIAK
ncbi:MAG: cellulase family glycosylhydrolase [Fibrobacter sp.]|nr:cellulase family glycosylhydrolase [Fibrobacter sp.]